tara:strand:+ start:445 stop:1602 length:1158 start_codon:yes stop_codon:yes gene_type:complete
MDLTIETIETFLVPPRWLFVKVTTRSGLAGWGEAVLEGRAQTVAAAIAELADYLIGQDSRRIEHHWQAMYRGGFYRGGPILMSAIAGIDQALWDIVGRSYDEPIHALLGGRVRDRMRVYAWVGGDTDEALVESARAAINAGFATTKMNLINGPLAIVDSRRKVDDAVTTLSKLRDAVGNQLDIAVDFHGRVHRPMAKVLIDALAPFHPLFIEEPVLPEHLEFMADLRRSTSIPIATGERLFSRYDFKRLLTLGAADIVQPDLSHAGGITESRKIASMAEAWDVALAPHCPLGPIALAACLQVDAVSHNAFIQEQSQGIAYNQANDLTRCLTNPEAMHFDSGFIKIPDGPGLGVEIDEEYVRRVSIPGHRWRNPLWEHEDGSIAEW